MKELSVGIVACASMHEQITECLASLEGSFRIYPIIPSCTFSVKIDLLRHYLDRSTTENDVTLLAYGICHPQILPLLAEYGDRVAKVEGSNCYEMFLGSEKYGEYHRRGYWMLNKPFFTNWKNELLTGYGVGTSNGRTLIGDTFKKLLYLKFEKDELSLDLVEDFARTVGLEYEIHSVDTANLKRLLEEALTSAYSTGRVGALRPSVSYPRQSEMRTMIENIGEIIYKVDIHTKQFTFVSPQVKRILGYTPSEFLGVMNDYLQAPFYHEDDRQQAVAGRYNFLVKCLNEGMQEAYEAEYRAKHKNGDVLWLRESIYPSYSPEGIIESFVGKIADITRRKRAEEQLKSSRDYLKKLTDSMWDAVFSVKMPERVIEWANDSFRLTGYEPEECIGKTTQLLYPDERGFFTFGDKLKSAIAGGKDVLDTEQLLRRKNGEAFPAEITTTFFKEKGKVVRVTSIVRDITKRKRMEEALRASEQKLRLTFESIVEGVVVTDLHGNLTQVNEAAVYLFGYDSKEEMIGRSAFELVAEKDQNKAIEHLKRTLEVGYVKNVEYTFLRRDGSEFEAELSTAVLRNASGNPIGVVAITSDIAKRRRAEEALRRSEERFRTIYEESPIGIELYASDGELITVNTACLDIFGVPDVAEVKGLKLFEDPNLTDEVKERLRKGETVRFEAPFNFEEVKKQKLYHTSKSGIIHCNVLITPLGLRRRKPLGGYLLQVQDVTQRKKAEKVLRESEENFRALAENANDGIVIIASNGQLLYANKGAAEMTGHSRRDRTKIHINHHIHPDELKRVIDRLTGRLSGKVMPRRYETLLVRKDGSLVPVELTVAKTIWHGEPAVLAIFRDISEQKRLRETMQFYVSEVTRAQEAERKHIARELHDETAQSLAILSLEIEAISREEQLSEGTIRRLGQLRAKGDSILEGVRRFSQELRPEVLDQLGLLPALELLTKGLNDEGDINAYVEVIGCERRLSTEAELVLFRIAQEALRNVRKHSKATEAVVRVEFTPQKVKVSITDNGKGFKLPKVLGDFASVGKMGLIGMQERARLLNASFSLKSKAGKGIMVVVEVEG